MKGHTKTTYELIKLEMLNEAADGSTVDWSSLKEAGVLTKGDRKNVYKVMGNGELTVSNLIVKAHAFTESARAAIESKGGKCIIMSPTRDTMTLEDATAARAVIDADNLVKLRELRALKAKTRAAKESASV
jgi:hypothetical protein